MRLLLVAVAVTRKWKIIDKEKGGARFVARTAPNRLSSTMKEREHEEDVGWHESKGWQPD